MRKNATNSIAPALMNVQFLSAAEGSILPNMVIARIPMTEAIRPTIAIIIGNAMYSKRKVAILAPITIAAIMDPQYDSNISAPSPAVSPTQSPTLSAITPGLRGSSSGIPASTLPTRSEPTSAVLV